MKKAKLLGIELCRGLATYAVILVHSGDETWGIPIKASAITFRSFFYFAVPFFLATAFYFMATKVDTGYSRKFWQSRIERILIPYIIWSAIYLVLRISVFIFTNKVDRLQQLLHDPLSIIVFGGASYHLYFLPLLLTGTSLVLLMPFLEKSKVSVAQLFLFSILSLGLYYLLEQSGNSFQLGPNIAFQNLLGFWKINVAENLLLRLIAVEIAWLLKCLPYFLVALTLNRIFHYPKSPCNNPSKDKLAAILLAFLFLLCTIWGKLFLFGALQELLLAFLLLFFGIFLSSSYSKSDFLSSLTVSVGLSSFGIYLIHPVAMNLVKSIISRFVPEVTASISIFSMISLSVPCFLISCIVVTFIARNTDNLVAKYLFGFQS